MKKKSTQRVSKPKPDKETPEWTREDFALAVPFSGLPVEVRKLISGGTRGPQKAPKKISVSIRLSPDVVRACQSSGPDGRRVWMGF